MKKIIVLVLTALCLVNLCACKSYENTENRQGKEKFVTISTPFAELKVRESFDENVSHKVSSNDPYTIVFCTKEDNKELFSLIFNGIGNTLMGTLIGKDENTVIYMNIAELDENSENYEKYLAYQEGVNDILNGLIKDYDFAVNETVESSDKTTFDINTPVVTMKYPKKWKDKVKIETVENGVKFSNNGTALFDLMFIECDGYLLGTYKNTSIYIVSYPAQSEEQIEMQEDVNVILQHLAEDPDFVLNK